MLSNKIKQKYRPEPIKLHEYMLFLNTQSIYWLNFVRYGEGEGSRVVSSVFAGTAWPPQKTVTMTTIYT